jgi:GLPGLI family protein
MKKSFLLVIISAILLGSSYVANGKDFKGVITYKITFSGMDLDDQMKSALPQTMISKYKGYMSTSELIMGMGKTSKIKNGKEGTIVTLMEMMGKKLAITSSKKDIEEIIKSQPESTLEIKDETKEILGYECQCAVITVVQPDSSIITSNVYFTKDLGTNVNHFDTKQFMGIDGIMLEFEVQSANMTMTFTATNIEKKNVPDSEFEIPDDYEVKTSEEASKMFGAPGGGGGF